MQFGNWEDSVKKREWAIKAKNKQTYKGLVAHSHISMSIKLISGNILTKHGFKLQAEHFENIKRYIIPLEEMTIFIKSKFPKIRTSPKDFNFKITGIENWEYFIINCWLKEKKWIENYYDCEDFADTFAVFAKLILGVSVYKIYGGIFDRNTGKWIGYHYWNAIISQEKNGKEMHFYEPMTGSLVQYSGQKEIVLDNWRYNPEQIICN